MHSIAPKRSHCFSYLLCLLPTQTRLLLWKKPLVSRTSNPFIRLISNCSFSEFRLSCQTITCSPGISSAASKPTVQKVPQHLLFTLIFRDINTNFRKTDIAYFRCKLCKEIPSQNRNSSAICALRQDSESPRAAPTQAQHCSLSPNAACFTLILLYRLSATQPYPSQTIYRIRMV